MNAHSIANKTFQAFASSCVSPAAVRLTATQMQLIVDGHNSNRNFVASGNLVTLLPARRMAKMSWDSQLAQFAELNTRQCRMVRFEINWRSSFN